MNSQPVLDLRAFFIAVATIFQIAGCAHEPRTSGMATEGSRAQLSQQEIARCEQVAWDAVNSADMLDRFHPERITKEPFVFSNDGMQCYLDRDKFDTVEVAVPSGGKFGYHSCYVGVTLKRDTYEVLSMRESAWP